MSAAVIVADRTGGIILSNRGAELVFGYAGAEALGQSLDLIIPERFRARHREGYRTVTSTSVTRYGREMVAVPAIRKDGSLISIEFSLALLTRRRSHDRGSGRDRARYEGSMEGERSSRAG